jgi:hypothetical protein
MKKVFLFAVLLSFGFSFGINDLNKPEIFENQMVNIVNSPESLNEDSFNEQFDFASTKELIVEVDCNALGVAVFDAAIEQGYSGEEAYDMGLAAGTLCLVLKLIGAHL